MSFQNLSIKEYMSLLSQKRATPGGGSALAITLELSISLCLMVVNFTIDKKGYEKVQNRMKELLITLNEFNNMASSLADEDSISFKELMIAFKTGDKIIISNAAKVTCEVPYRLYLLTEQVEQIAQELMLNGNKNVYPDAKTAQDLCYAIYPGCKANIEANISYILDEEFTNRMKTILN